MSNLEAASNDDPEGATDGDSETPSVVVRVLLSLRGSALLSIVVVGVLMIVVAATVLNSTAGGGLLGIIGLTVIVYAGLVYLGLRLIGYN